MDELAGASASSAAVISSRTSALTIPSLTGCDCLSCVIFRITSISFCGRLQAPVRQLKVYLELWQLAFRLHPF